MYARCHGWEIVMIPLRQEIVIISLTECTESFPSSHSVFRSHVQVSERCPEFWCESRSSAVRDSEFAEWCENAWSSQSSHSGVKAHRELSEHIDYCQNSHSVVRIHVKVSESCQEFQCERLRMMMRDDARMIHGIEWVAKSFSVKDCACWCEMMPGWFIGYGGGMTFTDMYEWMYLVVIQFTLIYQVRTNGRRSWDRRSEGGSEEMSANGRHANILCDYGCCPSCMQGVMGIVVETWRTFFVIQTEWRMWSWLSVWMVGGR